MNNDLIIKILREVTAGYPKLSRETCDNVYSVIKHLSGERKEDVKIEGPTIDYKFTDEEINKIQERQSEPAVLNKINYEAPKRGRKAKK